MELGRGEELFTDFNSTIVRLKVEVQVTPWWNKLHFNSTIVRLKADGADAHLQVGGEFQFYHSSIKRRGP